MNAAFNKMVAVGAEMRTLFRKDLQNHSKAVKMLFCFESGEMNPTRHIDLNSFGQTLASREVSVPLPIQDNLASLLECFGNLE